jgi:hypothetical protein
MKLLPIRDLGMIAERYLKGTLMLDFLAFAPFVPVITSYNNIIYENKSAYRKFEYL